MGISIFLPSPVTGIYNAAMVESNGTTHRLFFLNFVLLRQLATFASTLPAIPISCWTKNEDEKQAQHYQYAGPHVEVVLMRMFPMGRVLLVMGTFFQLSDAREPVPMQLGKSDAKFALSPQTPYNGLLFRSPVELGRPSQSVHEFSESLMRFLVLVLDMIN